MNPIIIKLLIPVIVGIPAAYIVLKIFLKNSILFKMGFYLAIVLILIIANTRIADFFPEKYPYSIAVIITLAFATFLVYLLYINVKKPFHYAIENLESLSGGKLDMKFSKKVIHDKNEFGRLYQAISLLSTKLKEFSKNVKISAEEINDVAHQLNTTSISLAGSTSSQASSLEEISSSMEEMASSIELNSNNSIKTNNIASKANDAVEGGNKAALAALESIQEIAEKIKLIDDIAFQTNILALNAAVEAAAAGEYGRGFSVVASEVKNLAEKSKQAVAQIQSISVESTLIAEKAIKQLNETLPLMQETTNLTYEISLASKEQTSGANQINNAVQIINSSTQENSVTAEELANSSRILLNQAKELIRKLEYFK
ncbi:MAG: hypothetical protein JXR51_04685 [Bacteroidales bacterium]|nr:hypothetical protein [Bacteroidales bacterium]MBN2756454.1 hypothetical protein [Bacteroidales bacterium]